MTTNTTDRVAVVTAAKNENPKRMEYAVTLDGEIVLRCGGTSVPDYGQASSFADGLRLGLSKR